MEIGGYEKLLERYLLSFSNTTSLYLILQRSNNTDDGRNHSPELPTNASNEAIFRYGPCGIPNPNSFHLTRPADDSLFPWTGLYTGYFVIGTLYFCTDQVCRGPFLLFCRKF